MDDKPERANEPFDQLTRLCDTMTKAMKADPEYTEDVKCIVFLNNKKRGGLQMTGYEDDTEAIVDLFIHLKAIFKVNGKELMLIPIHEG